MAVSAFRMCHLFAGIYRNVDGCRHWRVSMMTCGGLAPWAGVRTCRSSRMTVSGFTGRSCRGALPASCARPSCAATSHRGALPRLRCRAFRKACGRRVHRRIRCSCRTVSSAKPRGCLRRPERFQRGRVVWREPLVWMAASDYEMEAARPVRLVMMRPPCGYRAIMIEALASVRREWSSACLASNLGGVQAAVSVWLGITALGTSFLQGGCAFWNRRNSCRRYRLRKSR